MTERSEGDKSPRNQEIAAKNKSLDGFVKGAGLIAVIAGVLARVLQDWRAQGAFISVGLIASLMAFGHFLLTHYIDPERRLTISRRFWWSGILVTSGLVTLIFWALKPKPDLPRFRFLFNPEASATFPLELTNRFLVASTNGTFSATGYLLLPFPTGPSNASFNFTAVNDSLVLAEAVEVTIWLPKKWNCEPSNGWVPFVNSGTRNWAQLTTGIRETNELQSWGRQVPFVLHPGEGVVLPTLRVTPGPPFPDCGPIGIMVRAKGSSVQALAFNLAFIPAPTNGPPWLTPIIRQAGIHGELSVSAKELEALQR